MMKGCTKNVFTLMVGGKQDADSRLYQYLPQIRKLSLKEKYRGQKMTNTLNAGPGSGNAEGANVLMVVTY